MGKLEFLRFCRRAPVYMWNRKKAVTFAAMILGLSYVFTAPVRQFCIKMNYDVSPYVLPHMISNLYYQLSLMACVVFFYSDVPFTNQKEFYRIFRSGRTAWTVSCLYYLLLMGFAMMAAVAAMALIPLLPVTEWSGEWGKILYTLCYYGEESQLFEIEFDILNYFTPFQAMGVTVLLGGLVLGFFGILMFTISLYSSRNISMITGMVLVILPLMAENFLNLQNNVKVWYFSPISWMRLTRIELIYYRGLPNLQFILPCLAVLIFVCSIACVWKVRNMDFDLDNEG